MGRVLVKLKLDNQTYTYTTLQDIDAAIANNKTVIEQRLRRIERDREVVRRLEAGREDLAQQIYARSQRAMARNREKKNGNA